MSKTTFAHGQLQQLVNRIERLEEQKAQIAADIKEVYAEAKANGFDTKIIRKLISLRKLEPAEREELEAMMDVYKGALGMLPLFEAAQVETVVDKLRSHDEPSSPLPGAKDGSEDATTGADAASSAPVETHDPVTGEVVGCGFHTVVDTEIGRIWFRNGFCD